MTVIELTESPSLPVLFGKAALTGFARNGTSLPDAQYVRYDVGVQASHLADYNRVCGFRLNDVLPATYPHTLAFPMATKLMTAPDFPFPLVGSVHINNTITVHRPLRVTDRLELRVHARNLRDHSKGKQYDVISQAFVDGDLAWEDVSTYLRRAGTAGQSQTSPASVEKLSAPRANAHWRVGEDIGRRYARVSGDINPIHLHAVTARVLGFRKAIAHGMWTKARCLAALEGRLPERYTVDVRFQLPLLLAATVAFSESSSESGTRFALHDVRSGKPHLAGSVTGL